MLPAGLQNGATRLKLAEAILQNATKMPQDRLNTPPSGHRASRRGSLQAEVLNNQRVVNNFKMLDLSPQ
eukprot:7012003-Pyramimonas_sp.AAC.1